MNIRLWQLRSIWRHKLPVKGTLTALTRSAALKLVNNNIRIKAIVSCVVLSGMLLSVIERDQYAGSIIQDHLEALGHKYALK